MNVELVRVKTPDGYWLDGVLSEPDGIMPVLTVDAVIMLHGAGGNFCDSLLGEITPPLLELGITVLRVNTRGHDGVSTTPGGMAPRRQGAAFEVVDECRHDVIGWVDWLVDRGAQRIVLVGHSLGALKAVYSQSIDANASVVGVVAISPPRLSHAHFCASRLGGVFSDTYRTAQKYVDDGEPQTLLEVRVPIPLLCSAGTYVDKYGPAERYNLLRFFDAVNVPSLYVFGQHELVGSLAFAQLDETLSEVADPQGLRTIVTVDQADHFYAGVRPALSEKLCGWLQRVYGV
jgi:pimeloyl-ACP methyl ester carboxylesterase